MKKRISRVLNFFAFNLLFFALYLNFIHKDSNGTESIQKSNSTTIIKGTTLVTNPEQYLNKDAAKTSSTGAAASKATTSFN